MPPAEDDLPVEDSQSDDAKSGEPTRTISSHELLKGRRELWIDHEGEIYRLRLTSRGKLYLTK